MIKTGKFILVIWIGLLWLLPSFAEVSISTDVDRDQVELGDSFQVTVSVRAVGSVDLREPSFPKSDQFLMLGRNQINKQQVQFVNGKVTSIRTTDFIFLLQPNVKGDLAIPRMEIYVDGEVQKTAPKRIKVVDPGTLPKTGQRPQGGQGNSPFGNFPGLDNDPFADLLGRRNRAPEPKKVDDVNLNPNEAFQLRVVADKKEAFVGEQVTANYYIYIPKNYLLRSFDTVKYPNLKGFWKEDIELAQTLRYETVVVDGRSYNRALLASFALFPISEGTSTLDEYKVKSSVSVSGVFGFGKARTYTKSSRAETIKVKPLPVASMPEDFSGAVGTYTIRARIDSSEIKAHQPFAYKLKIEGNGNAKNIEMPSIDLPPELELFDTKEESQFFKTGSSFKEFTLYLIPRVDGQIEIPELKISVFNPANEKYEQIRSGALTISVAAGEKPKGVEDPNSAIAGNQKKDLPKAPAQFQFERAAPGKIAAYGNYLSYGLLLFVLVSNFLYAKKTFSWGSSEARQIQKYESRYKKLTNFHKKKQYRDLGVEATNTIYFTLSLCLEDVESGMELSKILKKISPNLRKDIEEPLEKSLKTFQTLGFAPEEMIGSLKDEKLLKQSLALMDEALRTLIKKHDS